MVALALVWRKEIKTLKTTNALLVPLAPLLNHFFPQKSICFLSSYMLKKPWDISQMTWDAVSITIKREWLKLFFSWRFLCQIECNYCTIYHYLMKKKTKKKWLCMMMMMMMIIMAIKFPYQSNTSQKNSVFSSSSSCIGLCILYSFITVYLTRLICYSRHVWLRATYCNKIKTKTKHHNKINEWVTSHTLRDNHNSLHVRRDWKGSLNPQRPTEVVAKC